MGLRFVTKWADRCNRTSSIDSLSKHFHSSCFSRRWRWIWLLTASDQAGKRSASSSRSRSRRLRSPGRNSAGSALHKSLGPRLAQVCKTGVSSPRKSDIGSGSDFSSASRWPRWTWLDHLHRWTLRIPWQEFFSRACEHKIGELLPANEEITKLLGRENQGGKVTKSLNLK